MKIAFLVWDFPRLSETFILNQVTGLLERGHEVHIYTEQIGDWSTVHPDVKRFRLWERTFLLQEVPSNYFWRVIKGLWLAATHFYKAPELIRRSLNIFAYGLQSANLWLLYSAVSLCDKQATYDIIHCQFGTQGYRGLTFKRLLKPTPKLLIMFRGHDISCYINQGGDKVYRQLFKDVDYCLANCNFFRKRVIDLGLGAEKISVHFSGLDIQKFKYYPRHQVSGEPVQIATVGRLVEKKGLEYAIRAVAQTAKDFPNINYQIIGDGSLKPSLEKLIQELGAESYVHLLGWKNEAEIIDILDNCHLFIAPSVTAADGNQDAPINVLKEAMAMGLPVVSTFHGGIPELVQDGVSGYLVPERDVQALSDRLERLLNEPERWPEMGLAGRTYVEQNFNLQSLNDRLVSRYQELLENQEPSSQSPLLVADSLVS